MKSLQNILLATCAMLLMLGLGCYGNVDVEGGLTRSFSAEPGKNIEGTIVLNNKSAQPQEVKVYQTDYLFYADGKNSYGDPGSAPRSNCPWISFSPKQFVIDANSKASVHFTIDVPDKPDLVGTYWSMLMIEPIAAGSLEPLKPKEGKVEIGLQTTLRYAVQMVVTMPQSGKKEIKFIDKRLINKNGTTALQLDVQNVGDQWLRPTLRADVYDSKGQLAGRFEGGKCRIYPDCSVRSKLDLSGLGVGKYSALVMLDNGDDSVWGARYEIEIK